MDFRLIEAALHSALSPAQRLVLVAMADCKWDANSICNPSIAALAELTGLSRRAILKAIATLKQSGIIALASTRAKGRKGETNTYMIVLEKLPPTPAKVGEPNAPTPAKVGEPNAPTPAKVGEPNAPKRNSSNNKPCVCHNAPAPARVRESAAACAAAHTHTFSNGDVFSDGGAAGNRKPITVESLSADCAVPRDFVIATLAEWKKSGWTTTQGKAITRQSIKAHLRAWWKNEKDRGQYEKPKATPRKFTAADWLLCAERCAHCTGNGCGKGITTPPDKGAHQCPPEECKEFAAIAAER